MQMNQTFIYNLIKRPQTKRELGHIITAGVKHRMKETENNRW